MYRILEARDVETLSVKVSVLLSKENAELVGAPFYDELNNCFCQAVNDSSHDQRLLTIEREIEATESIKRKHEKIHERLKENNQECYFYYSHDSFHLNLDKPEGYDIWSEKMNKNFEVISRQDDEINALRAKQRDILYRRKDHEI